jgi:DNA repair photolyase
MALAPVSNPPNPWHCADVDWLGPPPSARLTVYEDRSRSVLSRNDSPDLEFRWSVNPYRGCFHGCAYCYARPTHEYLDFGAGTDFDRRIVVKPDAPARLAEAFGRRSWTGELIVFSGNTDCYQPLEASYRLTRQCLEVCADHRNPVSIITKSPLVERDIDVLTRLRDHGAVVVNISVPFADAETARRIEPFVPPPARRLRAIERLARAGIPVGVFVAPIIPGLNDEQMVEVLERAREAGAGWASSTMVRLPGPVNAVFESRLRAGFPQRADRILHRIEDARGGRRNDARFGRRMVGGGAHARAIRTLFEQTVRRLGYGPHPSPPSPSPFERPKKTPQLSLF